MAKRRFGTITHRGGDSYTCQWSDPRGNRKSRTVHGTMLDAEMFLASVEMQQFGADRTVTYGEYWNMVVLPQIGTLEAKTQHEYKRLWSRELEPVLAKRMVAATSYRFAQAVIDGIEAPSVQRSTARLWGKICNMAVRDGILMANPVQRMTFRKHEKRPKAILAAKDVVSYVEPILTTRYGHIAVLEMCAGLRHEEACAVRWEDVEFDGDVAIVNVDKARIVVAGNVVDKDTKNAFSARRVPLAGVCAEMLGRCSISRVNPQTASHNFRQWCGRHGAEYVPFGQMRSNFATHAGECCDGSLVDLYMGHSGSTTTDRWYRSATIDGMLIVARSYEAYISSPGE